MVGDVVVGGYSAGKNVTWISIRFIGINVSDELTFCVDVNAGAIIIHRMKSITNKLLKIMRLIALLKSIVSRSCRVTEL